MEYQEILSKLNMYIPIYIMVLCVIHVTCAECKHYCSLQMKKLFDSPLNYAPKVSVQGVVALGGHFATLCQEPDLLTGFHEKTNVK